MEITFDMSKFPNSPYDTALNFNNKKVMMEQPTDKLGILERDFRLVIENIYANEKANCKDLLLLF
jgi:hypothetical protein